MNRLRLLLLAACTFIGAQAFAQGDTYILQKIAGSDGRYYVVVKGVPPSNEIHTFELGPEWLENDSAGLIKFQTYGKMAESRIVPISFTFVNKDLRTVITQVQIKPDATGVNLRSGITSVTIHANGESIAVVNQQTKLNISDEVAASLEADLPFTGLDPNRLFFSRVTTSQTGDLYLEVKAGPQSKLTQQILLGADWNEAGAQGLEKLNRLTVLAQEKAVPIKIRTESSSATVPRILSVTVTPSILSKEQFSVVIEPTTVSMRLIPRARDLAPADFNSAYILMENSLPSACSFNFADRLGSSAIGKFFRKFF